MGQDVNREAATGPHELPTTANTTAAHSTQGEATLVTFEVVDDGDDPTEPTVQTTRELEHGTQLQQHMATEQPTMEERGYWLAKIQTQPWPATTSTYKNAARSPPWDTIDHVVYAVCQT